MLATSTFAEEVTDALLRCQEQLLDPEDLAGRAAGRDDWRGLPSFYERYLAELVRTGRIDYGTLLATAARLAADPEVSRRLGDQFHHVLVDEYQDTTTAQARLLEGLTAAHRDLTVAADPYQSVYSFRGAELENVERFPNRFRHTDGNPAQRLVLTTSFRVPGSILDAAVRVTAGTELPGAAGPVAPAPGEGSVEVYGFDQQTGEAEWVAAEVQRLHLEQRIPYRRMAVFVRSKRRFLPELSRALDRRGVPHEPPDARLADHPAVRFVLDCVIAATTADADPERARAVRRLLLGPLFNLPLGRVREIERARLAEGLTWPAAVARMGRGGEHLVRLLEESGWATRLPAPQGLWHVWSTLPQVTRIVDDPDRGDERRAWASLAQVLGRLTERDPGATLEDYRRWTEEEDFEARPLLTYRRPDRDSLTLTTLHQAKGLEFDVVFIADAVEGVFPDLRARDSLLGVRHLLPHLPQDPAGYQRFRLQEETRLAYTAMTRARSRVVWTATATGFDEGRGIPSRFLAAVAGTDTVTDALGRPSLHAKPVTPLEAEAHLRRIAVDPSREAVERLAAVAVLATAEEHGLRPYRRYAGVRRRGPDTGVVPDRIVLSPSQAEAYLRCPRRYALERRLGVGDETSVYAALGSLVHEVLEAAEGAAAAAGEPRATAEDGLAELDRRFRPEAFGGGVFAEAWKRRAAQIVERLYRIWPPASGPAVALERPLELDIGGTSWVGRADRIEARPGGLTVVDYKTSKSPPRIDDAASSPQLGFYVLAVAAAGDLASHGAPAGAEMWYPACDTKGLTTREFDMDNLPDVATTLAVAADGIRAERFPPQPSGDCDTCRVRLVCPEWPEGREAYQP
jgi:superfamily I DNA/RNA helicase/RecB family exonuclease